MKRKGKLICRTGNVALLMEDHGSGEVFQICILQPRSDEVVAGVWIDMKDAAFLYKCLGNCLDAIMQHNVKEEWYGD